MALILVFHNDGTGLDHDANYNVEIRINDRVIESGRLEHHVRSQGWAALVQRYLDHRLCSACPGSTSAKPRQESR
jgi:hypothetical protein